MLLEGICNAKPSPIPAETERAILYAGTLHRQFGIHNLAAAFRLMKDPEAKLWFCGSGDSEDVVRELCKDDPRATFFGFLDQDQVQQLRKRAALLVNPRTAEGEYTKYTFPSTTMEYLASGKPVVMHKLAGIPSSYDPYLFYPEDNTPEALCHTLQYVLDHPAEAAEKGRRAQAFVLENKSSTVQGRRVVEFLSK
jgi:glycosyltransferase involved in cell wall biosynthesis